MFDISSNQLCDMKVAEPSSVMFESARCELSSSILFDMNDFAAFVETALGTHAMLHARLLTIRTRNGLWKPQRIMSAAFAPACF
jgi:hypothetical protein